MKQQTLSLLAVLATLSCRESGPVPVPAGNPAGGGPATAPAPADVPARSGKLFFEAQPGWTEEKPASTMRVAQYSLPRAEGDSEDGELAVFANIGGAPEDNLARWASQFEQPDGRPSSAVAVTPAPEKRGELVIHKIEVTGTFVAETMPGSGVRRNEPNWRLLGAVVESPYGPYFFKLVGPDATLRHWKDSFEAFLKSMKP